LPPFRARGLYNIVVEKGARPANSSPNSAPNARKAPAERIEAEFITSAANLTQCPRDELPEVAVAGRSNAGKSSVLNQITGNRRLARTSKTPGRTQLINFFLTRPGGRLVDLPGYGFAKASQAKRQTWQQHVEDYLSRRDNLTGMLLVMDIRHPFQPFDEQLIEWAHQSELALHILLNKADKLKRGARVQALRAAEQRLGGPPHSVGSGANPVASAAATVQLFSATDGTGKAQTIEWLTQRLTFP
jgi:GTP-binding protein